MIIIGMLIESIGVLRKEQKLALKSQLSHILHNGLG